MMSSTSNNATTASSDSTSLVDMVRILDVAAEMRADRELASREFAVDETRRLLRERLLASARLTGDPVTPEEVDAAIEQYFQSQHTFREPRWGLQLLLAHVYVRRWWITIAGCALIVATSGSWVLFNSSSGWLSAQARQTRAIESALQAGEQSGKMLLESLSDPTEKQGVEEQLRQLRAAVVRHDTGSIAAVQQQLDAWSRAIAEEYEVRILAGPEQRSAVRRDYNDPASGKRVAGYYVIVSARDSAGKVLPRRITNIETQKTFTVNTWGERVPEAVYERLKKDKQQHVILNETLFARKRRGRLTEEIQLRDEVGMPLVRQAQITQW